MTMRLSFYLSLSPGLKATITAILHSEQISNVKWVVAKLLVTQLCLTLCDPMDYSPLGSSVHGILQARILKWVTISFSKGSP